MFNREEITAVARLAHTMIVADGEVDQNEMEAFAGELQRFGVGEAEVPKLMEAMFAMKPVDAMAKVAHMNPNQKRYVCAFLAGIMVIDGEVHEEEIAVWRMTSFYCELPEMSIEEALEYLVDLDA
ncbi:MAG: hypothetical protein CSA07_03955 [Bacteroidia bacterium]|nr:MAG: hypothetical protein CSA07_03955 [Bacteroidia bacterium]